MHPLHTNVIVREYTLHWYCRKGELTTEGLEPVRTFRGAWVPAGSDGKESTCSVGDLGLIPGLGRSPGGQNGSLPREFHGQRTLAGYGPWDCKESNTTEHRTFSLVKVPDLFTNPLVTKLRKMCHQNSTNVQACRASLSTWLIIQFFLVFLLPPAASSSSRLYDEKCLGTFLLEDEEGKESVQD